MSDNRSETLAALEQQAQSLRQLADAAGDRETREQFDRAHGSKVLELSIFRQTNAARLDFERRQAEARQTNPAPTPAVKPTPYTDRYHQLRRTDPTGAEIFRQSNLLA